MSEVKKKKDLWLVALGVVVVSVVVGAATYYYMDRVKKQKKKEEEGGNGGSQDEEKKKKEEEEDEQKKEEDGEEEKKDEEKKEDEDVVVPPPPLPPLPPPPQPVNLCAEDLVKLSSDKGHVYFKLSDGRYLVCNDPGTIFSDGQKSNETKWKVEKAPDDSTAVRIINVYHNRYLSSEANGGLNAAVTPDKVSGSEVFLPICNESGTIFLKGSYGGYITVNKLYSAAVNATTAGANEVITVVTD